MTHVPCAQVDQSARYIHVLQDAKGVLLSFFGFLFHYEEFIVALP